jgi:fructose-1,6-bisphosphatase/sedoheptulose 1,7-bisphosphatase-like protein
MAKKMTIVEMYEAIIGKAKDVLSAEEIKFLEERAELVAKKNANRKPTKAQEENDGFKTAIVNGMESGKAYTITDLIKSIPEISDLTNQRVSALVRQLKDEGLVVRKEEKGKAYFSLA